MTSQGSVQGLLRGLAPSSGLWGRGSRGSGNNLELVFRKTTSEPLQSLKLLLSPVAPRSSLGGARDTQASALPSLQSSIPTTAWRSFSPFPTTLSGSCRAGGGTYIFPVPWR